MRRYEMISGILFALVAIAHLLRVLLGWPAQVAGFNIPVWVSVIAFIVPGAMAIWGFRLAGRGAAQEITR